MHSARCTLTLCAIFAAPLCAQTSAPVDAVSSASRTASLPAPDGPGTTTTLSVGDARIHLLIEDRPFDLSTEQLQAWVQQSAGIVAEYYAGFPIAEAWVAIRGARGGGVMNGRANATTGGAIVNVNVGLKATPDALAADWILVHELIHLAFPGVKRRHHWLEEGLSVYVESIARVHAANITTDQVWSGFISGMPNGLPRAGDQGLDYTPTWGRTYWGGALFCLLADIRIREATNGRHDLRDALRAIVAAGFNMTKSADIRDVLSVADQATGVDVLVTLYDEMRDQPLPTEINSLWTELGVAEREGTIHYDDDARQADIRRALTQR
jgi:hypothetical protein